MNPGLRDFGRRTVLITGAASGIGRETALAFAREGADLVLCDVSERALAETARLAEGPGRPGARITRRVVDVGRRDRCTQAMAAYGTTKYGVVGLSEALRDELGRHGIGVSTICPGLIRTPMIDTMPMRGERFGAGARERIVSLYERRNYGPDRVARAIVDAVRHGRGLVPVAPEAWAMYLTKRAFPSLVPALLRLAGKRWSRER